MMMTENCLKLGKSVNIREYNKDISTLSRA